jgi:hypothetical protein
MGCEQRSIDPALEEPMRRRFRLRRPRPASQRVFEFLGRSDRRRRTFKLAIIAVTGVTMALMVAFHPRGHYLVASTPPAVRLAVQKALRIPTPRPVIDKQWNTFRRQAIADSEQALVRVFQASSRADQGLMRYAGLDPDHAVLRWGNYNRTLLLPSTIFEPDDTGRSYRLLPGTRSIWLREISIQPGALMFFLVPDRPELREVIKGTRAIPVERSIQTTNSWGLRGPEPDLDAPLRGVVLGDSFMQGMFIADEKAPPECLRRDLEARMKLSTSILNTGHIGYSPEQYYYSLVAFADRFMPGFVVVSFFANDFGDSFEVRQGRAEWEEGCYWLAKIDQFCRARRWPCLFVAVPTKEGMFGKRMGGHYPGMVSNLLGLSATQFLNPIDPFIAVHLDKVTEAQKRGLRPSGCPLFNDEIHDGHFSPLGAEVWAAAVGRRLELILKQQPAAGAAVRRGG